MPRRSRLTQLEGVRGLAALIVVAWHFVWAFAPWELGSVAGLSSADGVVGNPLLAAIDGPAAVGLFFVLSGFVLPLGFLRSGNTRIVLNMAAKRWLRLAGLSLLSVLLCYAMFRLGLFQFRAAGKVTHSAWLATYGSGAPHGHLHPSLGRAVREGLVGAFVQNSDSVEPGLWTMRHELLGSFVSLGVALAMWNRRGLTAGAILLLALTTAPLLDPWLIPFIAGTGLAWLSCRRSLRLRWPAAMASIAVGLFLFGYLEPRGAYAGFAVLQDSAGYRYDRILVHTLAGLLVLLGLLGNESFGRALSVRPLLALGRLSFPIYLFHFPLLCSLACCLFLLLLPNLSYGLTLTAVAALYMPVGAAGGLAVRAGGRGLGRLGEPRHRTGVGLGHWAMAVGAGIELPGPVSRAKIDQIRADNAGTPARPFAEEPRHDSQRLSSRARTGRRYRRPPAVAGRSGGRIPGAASNGWSRSCTPSSRSTPPMHGWRPRRRTRRSAPATRSGRCTASRSR